MPPEACNYQFVQTQWKVSVLIFSFTFMTILINRFEFATTFEKQVQTRVADGRRVLKEIGLNIFFLVSFAFSRCR